MNRSQYFSLGVLSLIMLFFSIMIIQTGRIIYGVDAYIIAIMGYFFFRSLFGLTDSIMALRNSKQGSKKE